MALPRVGIFAGSFDPVHIAHINIVRREAPKFDQLYVAIAQNPDKSYMFSAEVRHRLFQTSVADIPNVKVVIIGNDFLVFEAKRLQAPFFIRGVRNSTDMDAELRYFQFNKEHWPECDTEFIPTLPQYSFISSSFVKGLIGPKGWHDIIQEYIPAHVYMEIVRQRLITFLTDIWQATCGHQPSQEVINAFVNYGQAELEYHNIVHPVKMLEERRRFGLLTSHQHALDLSILGHDLVNIPGRDNNVARSDLWMTQFMIQAGMPIKLCEEVSGLIEATDTHIPKTPDQALLIDLDLSILGQSPQIYDDYSQKIRQEYAQFSDQEYRDGRIKILQSFLNRPFIFNTEPLRDQYESQARQNIKREMQQLSQ